MSHRVPQGAIPQPKKGPSPVAGALLAFKQAAGGARWYDAGACVQLEPLRLVA